MSCVKAFISIVKVWKFWKTCCNYTLCLLWHVFLSITLWKWKFDCFEIGTTSWVLCDSFSFHCESQSLEVLKDKLYLDLVSSVIVFLSIPLWKWKFESSQSFERQVMIRPFVFCNLSSFPYRYESESLNVLKDKLLLYLVYCLTIFLSTPLWEWIVETFEIQIAITPFVFCDMFSFPTIVKVKVSNLLEALNDKLWLRLVPSLTGFPSWYYECESLKVLKDKLRLHLVSSVTGFPLHPIVNESLKALKVLKDKLWLHLVSSVTGFPFHTIVRVSETNIAPPPWLLVPSHREMQKFKKEIII